MCTHVQKRHTHAHQPQEHTDVTTTLKLCTLYTYLQGEIFSCEHVDQFSFGKPGYIWCICVALLCLHHACVGGASDYQDCQIVYSTGHSRFVHYFHHLNLTKEKQNYNPNSTNVILHKIKANCIPIHN